MMPNARMARWVGRRPAVEPQAAGRRLAQQPEVGVLPELVAAVWAGTCLLAAVLARSFRRGGRLARTTSAARAASANRSPRAGLDRGPAPLWPIKQPLGGGERVG